MHCNVSISHAWNVKHITINKAFQYLFHEKFIYIHLHTHKSSILCCIWIKKIYTRIVWSVEPEYNLFAPTIKDTMAWLWPFIGAAGWNELVLEHIFHANIVPSSVPAKRISLATASELTSPTGPLRLNSVPVWIFHACKIQTTWLNLETSWPKDKLDFAQKKRNKFIMKFGNYLYSIWHTNKKPSVLVQ